jgi:ribosomal protein RSM22 (predicted rRNA methylase)
VRLSDPIREIIDARAGAVPLTVLQRASKALSDHYRERGRTRALALKPEERVAAYLATRFPATYAAAFAVLRELASRIGHKPASILDLGAGTGAATLAAREQFPELERATLIETDAYFIEAGRELLPDAAWIRADLRDQHGFDPHDLVIVSYAVGELSQVEALAVFDAAWNAAQSAFVMIEPGTPEGYSLVLAARARLIERGGHLIAPCPWEGPCPLAGRDFCHFAERVERSAVHRRAKAAELSYEDEKFSYVVFSTSPAERARGRVIRRPEHSPGLITLEICRGEAVAAERVTKRDRERFRAARKARWGDPWNPE